MDCLRDLVLELGLGLGLGRGCSGGFVGQFGVSLFRGDSRRVEVYFDLGGDVRRTVVDVNEWEVTFRFFRWCYPESVELFEGWLLEVL